MSAIPFDTLKFVERLEAGGFTHSQAKAAAEAFAEATSQELATKSDLAVLKFDLRAEITAVKTDLIKWMVGLFFAQIALVFSILKIGLH
jgi:hypothetical protein